MRSINSNFLHLFTIGEKELYEDIIVHLDDMALPYHRGKHDTYIYVEGSIPILLVAHLDTVLMRTPAKEMIFYDQEKKVYWGLNGLGADDRAGVAYLLEVLKRGGARPSILFTLGEEIGGIGAKDFAEECADRYKKKFKMVIEVDRMGANDCVFYDCDNPSFTKFIESFGFKTARGTFSDISFICPAIGTAGVNLSIGYYNEHCVNEIFWVELYRRVTAKIDKIIDRVAYGYDTVPYYEYIPRAHLFAPKEDKCMICGKSSNSMIEVDASRTADHRSHLYCMDCFDIYGDFCPECSQPYEVTFDQVYADKYLCPVCLEKEIY